MKLMHLLKLLIKRKTLIIILVAITMIMASLIFASAEPIYDTISGNKTSLDLYTFYIKERPPGTPRGQSPKPTDYVLYGTVVSRSDLQFDNDDCPKTNKDGKPVIAITKSTPYKFVSFHHDPNYVNPKNIDEFGHNPDEIKGGLARTAYIWATEIFGDGLVEKTRDLLKISTEDNYSKLWKSVEAIYMAIAGIGIAIMLVYFLTELIEKMTQENFNLEGFVKILIRLLVAVIIINSGLPLFSGALEFSNKFLDVVANPNPVQVVKPHQPPPGTPYVDWGDYDNGVIGYTDGGSNNNSTTETADTSRKAAQGVVDSYWERATKTVGRASKAISDLIIGLSMLVELIVPYLMTWLIKVIVQVLCYSRAIELFVRAAFAPIGMANIFEGGVNSSGFRYFKKFLAVGLQGATIIVILLGYSALAGVINESSLEGTLMINSIIANQVILGFATLTLILKSQSWANDIVGV